MEGSRHSGASARYKATETVGTTCIRNRLVHKMMYVYN